MDEEIQRLLRISENLKPGVTEIDDLRKFCISVTKMCASLVLRNSALHETVMRMEKDLASARENLTKALDAKLGDVVEVTEVIDGIAQYQKTPTGGIPEHLEPEVVALYRSGETYESLGKRYQVSFGTIRKVVDSWGAGRSRSEAQLARAPIQDSNWVSAAAEKKRETRETLERDAYELWMSGLNAEDISAHQGVGLPTVRKRLRAMGVMGSLTRRGSRS